MGAGGREQKVSHGLADRRHGAIVGQQIFVDSVVMPAFLRAMRWAKNMINEGSCPCFFGS